MELSLDYIKNKILELIGLDNNLFREYNYPIPFARIKKESVDHNISFDEEYLKTYNTWAFTSYTVELVLELEKEFNITIRDLEIPDNISEIKTKKRKELLDIFIENKIISSKSEFRRLMKEGAIDVDGKNIKNAHYVIEKEVIIKIGKKKFVKIII